MTMKYMEVVTIVTVCTVPHQTVHAKLLGVTFDELKHGNVKDHYNMERNLAKCEATSQAIWPPARSFTKWGNPKAPSAIH
jgi:hypothetical protein